MPTLAHANTPTPKSWDEFEDILLSAVKLRWSSPEFSRHARSGQNQQGVDLYGYDAEGRLIGVQAKNTVDGISEATVHAEMVKAESFTPALEALYIATTAKRDANIQRLVRTLSNTRRQAGKFAVSILFWDDIVQDLARDENEFFKHYPQLRPKVAVDRAKKRDHKLYDALTNLLTSDGVIGFLDQTNMAGFSFDSSHLNSLREFYYKWNVPEREFMNTDLDALRSQLWQKADQYLDLIAFETFPTGNGHQSVPSEWEYDQPERFRDVVKVLHRLAGEIVDLHGKLVRTGRSYFLEKV